MAFVMSPSYGTTPAPLLIPTKTPADATNLSISSSQRWFVLALLLRHVFFFGFNSFFSRDNHAAGSTPHQLTTLSLCSLPV